MPRSLEHVDQLAQGVLGLGDGEPVAGHDDHPVGVAEQDRDVLRAGRAHRPVADASPAAERRAALERAEQDVGHRAAHRRGHQPGQERAGGADQGAGDQQQRVVQHVAAGGDGQAGEGVEQRDHDRYVGAADRQHQQHARPAAPTQREQRCRPSTAGVGRRSPTASADGAPAAPPPNSDRQPGKTTGRVVISSCSLAKVTSEPAKETEPTRIVNARRRPARTQPVSRRRRRRSSCSSSSATSAAAPPPTPLNSATICGIWVICTRRAPTSTAERCRPRSRPGSAATWSRSRVEERDQHGERPRRRRRSGCRGGRSSGAERPLSARMKQTAATR